MNGRVEISINMVQLNIVSKISINSWLKLPVSRFDWNQKILISQDLTKFFRIKSLLKLSVSKVDSESWQQHGRHHQNF